MSSTASKAEAELEPMFKNGSLAFSHGSQYRPGKSRGSTLLFSIGLWRYFIRRYLSIVVEIRSDPGCQIQVATLDAKQSIATAVFLKPGADASAA